jgi:tetratricopeptide (TPR) repeat protein
MYNPYIAGAPVTEAKMFFGREDVFRWIERSLTGKYVNHILVVHGQRRVGKTSVLKQLPFHLPERYVPVFFDLQGHTQTNLDRFLWWLAREITWVISQERNISISAPDEDMFIKNPEYFETEFLTNLRSALDDRILLLTFDEFDMLEEPGIKSSIAPHLINYLRKLMSQEGLGFIFSIGSSGQKLENMRASYTDFFKAALYKKISFLGREDTKRLITEPVRDLLTFDRKAVDRIYTLTSGHPYFTQLVCHELFSQYQVTKQKRISVKDVESVLIDVIERGTVNLKFVWDEASNLEKWTLAILAHSKGKTDSREISDALTEQRVRFSVPDLNSGLLHLREKDVLTEDNRFVIPLMRIWLEKNRPLERVRQELIEINPIANRYIEIGQEYKDLGQHKEAIENFQHALNVDPENLQARVGIASVYLIQRAYKKAVNEYEKALAIDDEDIAARNGLCEAHLAYGDQALSRDRTSEAVKSFEQALGINPEHAGARERMTDFHALTAERALLEGRNEDALKSFEAALKFTPGDVSLSTRQVEVREMINSKRLSILLAKVEKARMAKAWDTEIAFLGDAIKLDPDDQALKESLAEAKGKKHTDQLEAIRTQANEAIKASLWDEAVAAWERYLALEPNDSEVKNELLEVRRQSRQSRLSFLKKEAYRLAKEEKWDQSLAAWHEYQTLNPEDREGALAEIEQVKQWRDLAHAYAEAEEVLNEKKNYKKAIRLLKEIVAEDPTYKDASSLLAKAVEMDRGRRPAWQRFLLIGGVGASLLVVLVLALYQLGVFPEWQVSILPTQPSSIVPESNLPFSVGPDLWEVQSWDWPVDSVVTLNIDDPRNGPGVDYTDKQTVGGSEDDPESTYIRFEFKDFIDVHPGFIVTLSDNSITRTLVVTSLMVMAMNPDTDQLTGSAEANSQIAVQMCADKVCTELAVTADQDGNWLADFNESYDLVSGSEGAVLQYDDDGDFTQIYWQIPSTSVSVQVNTDNVEGVGWPLGAEVTMTIDDPSNGTNVDYTDRQIVVQAPWDPEETQVMFRFEADYDVFEDHIVTLTDGVTTRIQTVSNIDVTSVDPSSDTITGTSRPGGEIHVGVYDDCCYDIYVTADDAGNWTADFSGLYDLVPESEWIAQLIEADGITTGYEWLVPNPFFSVSFNSYRVEGEQWPLGAEVTMTIDDPSNGPGVDYTDTQTVVQAPWNPPVYTQVEFRLDEVFDVQMGHIVTMTDGVTTRSHTVLTINVTFIDPEADRITGTSDPGSEINVTIHGDCCYEIYITTDDSGFWTADFSGIYDLVPGTEGAAKRIDAEGNSTWYEWLVTE